MSWLTKSRFTWNEGAQRTSWTCRFLVICAEPALVILTWEPFGKVTWENIGTMALSTTEVAIWLMAPLSMIHWINLELWVVDDEQKGVELPV